MKRSLILAGAAVAALFVATAAQAARVDWSIGVQVPAVGVAVSNGRYGQPVPVGYAPRARAFYPAPVAYRVPRPVVYEAAPYYESAPYYDDAPAPYYGSPGYYAPPVAYGPSVVISAPRPNLWLPRLPRLPRLPPLPPLPRFPGHDREHHGERVDFRR